MAGVRQAPVVAGGPGAAGADVLTGHPDRRVVRGWGRATASHATLVTPIGRDGWQRLLADAGPRGLVARGAGSGYGDCAQNAGGQVASTAALTGVEVDDATATVTVGAGVRLADLVPDLVARGWTLPVVPGIAHVTIGGAIAADVHGKNHPAAGSFGSHVRSLGLLTPALGEITVGPHDNPDVFWATVGGLGLTGVILRARVDLVPAETAWMWSRDERCADLDSLLAAFHAARAAGRSAAAWLDGHARGAAIGRGVVTTAWPARLDELPARVRGQARHYRRNRALPVPPLPGPGVVGDRGVRAVNAVHWQAARRRGRAALRPAGAVLHPLDAIYSWPGLYGRRGLVQYQCAVPEGGQDVLREILALASAGSGRPSLVTVKQFGAANPAPLSFPAPGWTLALDFAAGVAGLAERLDAADAAVAAAGGRVYLVKDARLRPDLLPRMYPGLERWRAVRAALDPEGRLRSDLSRRLRLTDVETG